MVLSPVEVPPALIVSHMHSAIGKSDAMDCAICMLHAVEPCHSEYPVSNLERQLSCYVPCMVAVCLTVLGFAELQPALVMFSLKMQHLLLCAMHGAMHVVHHSIASCHTCCLLFGTPYPITQPATRALKAAKQPDADLVVSALSISQLTVSASDA